MKYLVIDNTKRLPICSVVESGGSHVGNTQMLCHEELKDYSKWLGLYGGRRLVDAFEVRLINDGMLLVWPVDEAGDALHDECDALEIRHYDTGARLVWEAKIKCDLCCGQGHFNLYGQAVEEDDLCLSCDGNGHNTGLEFETDIDGNLLTPNCSFNRTLCGGPSLGSKSLPQTRPTAKCRLTRTLGPTRRLATGSYRNSQSCTAFMSR